MINYIMYTLSITESKTNKIRLVRLYKPCLRIVFFFIFITLHKIVKTFMDFIFWVKMFTPCIRSWHDFK